MLRRLLPVAAFAVALAWTSAASADPHASGAAVRRWLSHHIDPGMTKAGAAARTSFWR